jgi:hypothetical protein
MAFGLALDPGLVALSRQAGSPIPAVAFGLLAVGFVFRRQWALAGVLGGLALLSGPALVAGALGLLLTWGLFRLLIKVGWVTQGPPVWPLVEEPLIAWRNGLLALGLTILAAGLLFLRFPQGLAALAHTLPDYLRGWLQTATVPALRLPAALLVYQTLVVLFALVAALRGWMAARSGLRSACFAQFFSLWALVALLLSVLYPPRQVSDLAWTLIPLWALAALEIARHLPVHADRHTRLVALGLAGLVLLLTVIAWINVLSLLRMNSNQLLVVAVILGTLLMAGIAALLVGLGWSFPAARMGFVWGVLAGLSLWLLSATFGVSQFRAQDASELWNPTPTAGQVAALSDTLSDLSSWTTGFGDQIDIVVNAESPVLRWLLRTNPNVSFDTLTAASESPAILITWKDQASPAQAQSYRGQDFILSWYPGWQGVLPSPLLPWLAFRDAPLAQTQIVLWARVDTFPGGALDFLDAGLDEQTEPAPDEQWAP